jgi:hypothetical protein
MIDEVSSRLKPWFCSPILYQLVDATRKHPLVPNPLCICDGAYWWVFYTEKGAVDSDLRITQLLINAPLSRTLKHYPQIRENARAAADRESAGPLRIYADTRREAGSPRDLHAQLIRQLLRISHVQLVARLKDSRLGHPAAQGIRVFIPDVHLLSRNRARQFNYATNHVNLLTDLAGELVTLKQSAAGTGLPVTVYQLGDFVDLWREKPPYSNAEESQQKTETFYQKVLEDHLLLSRRLFGPELGTRRVLGNHDFDTHDLETCIGAELRYYFPRDAGSGPVAVALHGDLFDSFQRDTSEQLQHWATYHFGPRVRQAVYDLDDLSARIVANHAKQDYRQHLRLATPASLGRSMPVEESMLLKEDLAAARFNVQIAGDPRVPSDLLLFVPEAERFSAMVNDDSGWNLRCVVIGHTHSARIVLDERPEKAGGTRGGFFTLVDCGAWLEEGSLDGTVIRNAQIGVLYDNDVRIYQLSPR